VPLQLKGPTLSQPILMLTEGNPMPQGSRSSIHAESAGVGKASLHQFGLPNPYKASSFSPLNLVVVSEAFRMDVDDVARTMDDPITG
jgi:hypothetical protein